MAVLARSSREDVVEFRIVASDLSEITRQFYRRASEPHARNSVEILISWTYYWWMPDGDKDWLLYKITIGLIAFVFLIFPVYMILLSIFLCIARVTIPSADHYLELYVRLTIIPSIIVTVYIAYLVVRYYKQKVSGFDGGSIRNHRHHRR
jgi:hypothetical protein